MSHRPRSPARCPWAAPALLATALAVGAGPARALKDDDRQPMLIEADRVELDEAKSLSIYIGNVQVDQGSMRLLADRVTVTHRPDRRIRSVAAQGDPVKYRQLLDGDQGEVQAFAKRMDFDADKNELTLIDDAVLIQGGDRMSSSRIVYDRARARMQAGGTGRVKIVISPERQQGDKPAAAGPTPGPAAPSAPTGGTGRP